MDVPCVQSPPSIHPPQSASHSIETNTFDLERLLPETELNHTQNSLPMILSFTVTGSSSL
jgi:hypothetical protein